MGHAYNSFVDCLVGLQSTAYEPHHHRRHTPPSSTMYSQTQHILHQQTMALSKFDELSPAETSTRTQRDT